MWVRAAVDASSIADGQSPGPSRKRQDAGEIAQQFADWARRMDLHGGQHTIRLQIENVLEELEEPVSMDEEEDTVFTGRSDVSNSVTCHT
jgi:hypothetical protein